MLSLLSARSALSRVRSARAGRFAWSASCSPCCAASNHVSCDRIAGALAARRTTPAHSAHFSVPASHLPWAAPPSQVPTAFTHAARRSAANEVLQSPNMPRRPPLPVTDADIPPVPLANALASAQLTPSGPRTRPPTCSMPLPAPSDSTHYDIIVIGGGHAGCEAAAASARCGARTLLLTHRLETVGEMSCNPSIGGIGKGVLVKEIDALGGLMGEVTDKAGVLFKILNRSRGPAVWGPRAQADRDLYRTNMQAALRSIPNLTIVGGDVEDIILTPTTNVHAPYAISGARLSSGEHFFANHVVLTTGTFLRGVLHIGPSMKVLGGRYGEQQASALSLSIERAGLTLSRLTTATPPRLDGNTIDYTHLPQQWGDEPPVPFSHLNDDIDPSIRTRQLCSYITYTSDETHRIIRDHAHMLPRNFAGNHGRGQGPRYCPSIEKKIVRFENREHHRVWLEPEGLSSHLVYPNGLSTGFPPDVQVAIIRSIPGLEHCKITRAGYAVEYDFVDPKQLRKSLEVKRVRGLFLAGQINGTTGYEEAAAQGVIAGINASLSVKQLRAQRALYSHVLDSYTQHVYYASPDALEQPLTVSSSLPTPVPWYELPAFTPFTLDRADAYIGVLIDDLTTLGATEPYRMFTARAEYRLLLRADNADLRLGEAGHRAGAVTGERWRRLQEKLDRVRFGRQVLERVVLTPDAWNQRGFLVKQDGRRRNAADMLAHDGVTMDHVHAAFPVDDAARAADIQRLRATRELPPVVPEAVAAMAAAAAAAAATTSTPTTSAAALAAAATAAYLPDYGVWLRAIDESVLPYLETEYRYAADLERQRAEIERMRAMADLALPEDMDYAQVPSISSEERERLRAARPTTLGEASRLEGITPTSIMFLLMHLKRAKQQQRYEQRKVEVEQRKGAARAGAASAAE